MEIGLTCRRRQSVLLTGGSGFIGRNILPLLSAHYTVFAPDRNELDLSDDDCSSAYLAAHRADFLVHCAILDPVKACDVGKGIYEDTVAMFSRLVSQPFQKIVYIGSGAEFDKSRDIVLAREEDFDAVRPTDAYGMAKRTLNEWARASQNIFNLRIFGCYGPYEPERRFLRHAIECCFRGEPITIRRDCRFSYVNVQDLGYAILRLLAAEPKYHDYNLCGGRPFLLSELAEIVREQIGAKVPIQVQKPGFANEYTGDDDRFVTEFPDFTYLSVKDGIAAEINWMKGLNV